MHYDATQEFASILNDPSRWIIKPGVPVFKPHQRIDPNTGKLIVVDEPKLYRIAAKMQFLERAGGVPARLTLGHTEPGKPETHQPPVAGYYRNARVQRFGPRGELAVVCDEWLDPTYSNVRRNYPYRSSEYYDSDEQITGVALLTRDPYLDLGVVAYSRGIEGATHYGRTCDYPTGYHLLIGADMFPQYAPSSQLPFAAVPTAQPQYPQFGGQPVAPLHSHPVTGQPVTYGYTPTAPAPVNYAQPGANQAYPQFPPVGAGFVPESPPAHYGTWPQPPGGHQRANIGHQHPNQRFAHQGQNNYAYGDMGAGQPGMGGGMGQMGGQGEVCPHCGQPMTGYEDDFGGQVGFPGSMNQPPAMNGRMGYSRGYSGVSGIPVAYAQQMAQVGATVAQLQQQNQVLMYERDQADTAACVEAINGLAYQGFPVGEYEIGELKNKNPQERQMYIRHIMTRYQQVPTSSAPPIVGDPTPYLTGQAPMPMTEAQMRQALAASEQTGVPFAAYARGQAPATHYGQPVQPSYGPMNPYQTSQPGYGYDPNQVAASLPNPQQFGFTGM